MRGFEMGRAFDVIGRSAADLSGGPFTHPIRYFSALGEFRKFCIGDKFDTDGLVEAYRLWDDADLSEYSVRRDAPGGLNSYGMNFSEFSYDGSWAFVLMSGKSPIACASFDVGSYVFEEDGKAAVIRQIQGRKGARKQLLPLRWEKLLVRAVERWARTNGAGVCAVSSAKSLLYANEIGMERAVRRYDTTAEEMGFERHEDGFFYLKEM